MTDAVTTTDWLRATGFWCATLWALDSNDRARRFYRKAGWVPDGATKVDEREGFSLQEVRYRIAFGKTVVSEDVVT
jgi:hypothetical protein